MLKHIGISFHSLPENLEKVLSKHPEIEVVQIQANYYDYNTDGARENGGCREVYEICRKYNKPVIIMEPLKGGNLAEVDQHPEVKKLFEEAAPKRSAVSWGLSYAASLEGVVTVLSGMSTIEQMKDNYKLMIEDFKPLTEEEMQMLGRVAKIIEGKGVIGCTGCRYCVDEGCPAGINIPKILSCMNMIPQYQNLRIARLNYYQTIEEHGLKDCQECGACETACPQKLAIRELLKQADEQLYVGENYDPWANH